MKKALILTAALCLASLCACGGTGADPVPPSSGGDSAPLCVKPQDNAIDLSDLGTQTLRVSFSPDDLQIAGDTVTLRADIYAEEIFDAAEVSQLSTGDSIVVQGQTYEVTSLVQNDDLLIINGGIENGGTELLADEGGTYRYFGMDDANAYDEQGLVTLPVDSSCVLQDDSDLDRPDRQIALADIASLENTMFIPGNTTVDLTDGVVTAIHRTYIP